MNSPDPIPTDTIVPLHLRDNAYFYRRFVADVSFFFDDVLDTDLVRGSLEELIDFGEWRKLGARLRLRVSVYFATLSQNLANAAIGRWRARISHS